MWWAPFLQRQMPSRPSTARSIALQRIPIGLPCGQTALWQACTRRPVAARDGWGVSFGVRAGSLRGSSGHVRGAESLAAPSSLAAIPSGSRTPQRGVKRASRDCGGITMPEARIGTHGTIQRRRARLSLHMPGICHRRRQSLVQQSLLRSLGFRAPR